MRNPTQDASLAFGLVLTLLTIWSFREALKAKQSESQTKLLHAKLDLVLSKLKTTA